MKTQNRIVHYDILRGIAISLMVMANSVASVYTATPPLFMRLMGSFAAPSFMILAGMMLAMTKTPKPLRGLHVIAMGCLIDVALWRIVPFITFDVLYMIGTAIVITAYPARVLSATTLWLSGLFIFLAGQGLQLTLGYQHEIFEIFIPPRAPLAPISDVVPRVLHQFFIDGWFPLFPWLGFVWTGAALQRSIQAHAKATTSSVNNISPLPINWLLYSILSLILASACWAFNFVTPEPRMGYSELFYAPTVGFCFTALSVFCVMLFGLQIITRWQAARFILAPFNSLGQRSLWIYVFHMIAIEYILLPYFVTPDLTTFLFSALMLWGCCVLLARLLIAYTLFNQKKTALHMQRSKV
ncbi:MAG: DUF1624 domain-containing protein [Methylococcaceae bacterium]|nr:DUF1624 domain-containing protein [Methylococcaceae bacterium]